MPAEAALASDERGAALLDEFRGAEEGSIAAPATEAAVLVDAERVADGTAGGAEIGGPGLAPAEEDRMAAPASAYNGEAIAARASDSIATFESDMGGRTESDNLLESATPSYGSTGHSPPSLPDTLEIPSTRAGSAAEEWPEDVWSADTADAAGGEGDTGEFWTAGDPDLSLGGVARARIPGQQDPAFFYPADTDEHAAPAASEPPVERATSSSAARPAGDRASSTEFATAFTAMNRPAVEAEWTRLTAGTPAEGTPMPLAEALEVLASRIRAGTLQASGYEPGMGDAAALAAALAAVLGVKR